jgi:beta-1,4-mannosyl-glycoprotein beta-1,4-N-acetylglucosaminyltransferase
MDFYYYNLNSKLVNKWNHAKIVSYKQYKSFRKDMISVHGIRHISDCLKIKSGGWHLSYFGTPEFISNKITNFSHQEFNNSQFNDIDRINENLINSKDIFNRPDEKINFISINDNVYLPPDYQIYLKDYFK